LCHIQIQVKISAFTDSGGGNGGGEDRRNGGREGGGRNKGIELFYQMLKFELIEPISLLWLCFNQESELAVFDRHSLTGHV